MSGIGSLVDVNLYALICQSLGRIKVTEVVNALTTDSNMSP